MRVLLIALGLILSSYPFHLLHAEKLYRAGVEVPAKTKDWRFLNLPDSMKFRSPDYVLFHKKSPKRIRLVTTQFNKTGSTCSREMTYLKKKGFKVRSQRLKGFSCLIDSRGIEGSQLIAVKKVKRRVKGRSFLTSQVVVVERNPSSKKEFISWVRKFKVIRK